MLINLFSYLCCMFLSFFSENLIRPPRKIISLRPDSSKDRLITPPLDTITEVSPVSGKVDQIVPVLGPLSSEIDSTKMQPQSENEKKEEIGGQLQDEMRKTSDLDVHSASGKSGLSNGSDRPLSPVESPKPRTRSTQVAANLPQSPSESPKQRTRSTQVATNLPQSPSESPKPRTRSTQVPPKKSMLPVLKTSTPTPSKEKEKTPASRIPVSSSRKVNPPGNEV